MSFPDFPFDDDQESFVSHRSVLQYLENYADKFELRPYIQVHFLYWFQKYTRNFINNFSLESW